MVERPPVLGQLLISLYLFVSSLTNFELDGQEKLFFLPIESKATAMLLLSRGSNVSSGCMCVSLPQSFIADRSTAIVNPPCRAKQLPFFHLEQVQELTGCKTAQGLREVHVGGRKDCGCHNLREAELVYI